MVKVPVVLTVFYTACLVSANELAPGEVKVRFYSGPRTNDYTDYPIESGEYAITNSAWDSSRPAVIYIHGLNGNADDESTRTIVSAYLERACHNVLAIDYTSRAKISTTIIQNVGIVGVALGQLIGRFVGAGVPLSSIHVIGFGLGPHVAAHASRTLPNKVWRITALDPALPGFYRPGVTHIEATDAIIVDVIHTDSGILGVERAIGTVDFYPNSGYALQPGCTIGFTLTQLACSSNKSWYYYAESVKNPTAFPAIACNSWSEFRNGACRGQTDYMGYGYSLRSTSTFYLQTNDATPYSMGNNGVNYHANILKGLDTAIITRIKSIISAIFQ